MQIEQYEAKKNEWLQYIRDNHLTSIIIKDIKFKPNFNFDDFPIVDMLILMDQAMTLEEIKFIRPAEDYLFDEVRKIDADVFMVFRLDLYREEEHRSLATL